MDSLIDRFARPAVFGATDGITVVVGVLLSLAHRPQLILAAALGVAVAEAVGMALGEWLSDSDSGLGSSVVIGGATAAASIAPAIPYALAGPAVAVPASVGVFAALGGVIAWVRARQRGWGRALLETYGVLVAAVVAVWLCELLAPGGGGA